MTKTATIRARVEPDLKQEAEIVFSELGLSVTQAIRLFYRQQVALQRRPAVCREGPERRDARSPAAGP